MTRATEEVVWNSELDSRTASAEVGPHRLSVKRNRRRGNVVYWSIAAVRNSDKVTLASGSVDMCRGDEPVKIIRRAQGICEGVWRANFRKPDRVPPPPPPKRGAP